MRLVAVIALSCLAAVAQAAPHAHARATKAPPPSADGALQGLGVHEAARFLAAVYQARVVVLGGAADPVALTLDATDAPTAFARLAKAAGLRLARRDAIFVLAPKDIIATASVGRHLPPDGRVDFDLLEADAMDVFHTLADALKLAVDGTVRGRVSVFGQGFGALTLVGVLSRLSGREASRHAGRLLVSGRFPDAPLELAAPPCLTIAKPVGELSCVDGKDLELVAAATSGGDQAIAALRGKTSDGKPTLPILVHVGDQVGRGGAKVTAIDAGGATLGDGTRLALRAP